MDEIFYEKIHIICQNIMASHPVAGVLEISLFYYKNRKITALIQHVGAHINFFPLEKIITKYNCDFFCFGNMILQCRILV